MLPAASPLTTHVLDTAKGRPAAGIGFILEAGSREAWSKVDEGRTDADGRASLLKGQRLVPGAYRLTFDTADRQGFYPEVTICFSVTDPDQHYHVPLLLSPFGYSTYRGS